MPLSPNPYAALKEASQYVRLFRGKTFVVKVGGEVLAEPKIRKALCEQLALLWSFSIKVVVVHGGGAELDAALGRLGRAGDRVRRRPRHLQRRFRRRRQRLLVLHPLSL